MSIFRRIDSRKIVNNILYKHLANSEKQSRAKRIERLFWKFPVVDALSEQEKAQITKFVSDYPVIDNKTQERCCEFYKTFTGKFSNEYIPDWLYFQLEQTLNSRRFASFIQFKPNLDFFVPESNRCETIMYRIDGDIFDSNHNYMRIEDSVALLEKANTFVLKWFSGRTGGGRGVQKIDLSQIEDGKEFLINKIRSGKANFIIQKVLVQHPFMQQFSKCSVNTIRVLSLYLHGECTILSSFVRMGGGDGFVDNLHSGEGALVGLKSDGTFHDWGIDPYYNKISVAPTGVEFAGKKIPNWDNIISFVKHTHRNFREAHLIGWDISINELGIPVVIEVNLDSAEIEAHQIFNGPVFGERLGEVLEFYREYPPRKTRIIRAGH